MSPSFSGLDLEALAIPMALVTDPPVPSRHPIVTFDATPGVEAACHHLLELGHRRIAWIGLRYSRNIGDQKHVRKDDDQDGRRATLSRCLKSAGLELVDDITIQLPEQLDRDRARQLDRLAKDLLWERKRLGAATAFVCFNDIMACAAIRALGAMGLSTPGDTSVVGVDNLWGDLLDPALTTIDMHLSAIGRRAAEIAIHMADHPRKRDRWTHQREIIPSTLVTRNSTGPAPHKES
jgi:LacI family transcriptional regulator